MLNVDSTAVQVTYDAFDRAVEQNRGGSYTQIVYAPYGGKLALMNGTTLLKAFVSLPGGPTAVYAPGTTGPVFYRHADWLGSSRLASTQSRTKYFDVSYAPFGENYNNSGTTDYNFTGQNQDTVTGYGDFLFREYSPVQGRWMSPDPAGLAAVDPANPQSWNRYAYVLNNPLALIDPLGLDACYDANGHELKEVENDIDCAKAGGNWVVSPVDYGVGATANVSAVPTSEDDFYFFLLWASGVGPSTINYGPNDGMTQQLAGTNTFNQLRQSYKQQGCPNTGNPIHGGDHVTPFIEGYVPPGNAALAQVGGFSAYGSTSGNVTAFSIVNVAGQASFSGATTFGPTGAYALSVIGGAAFSPLSTLTANGVSDNPYGPTGPFHNITQTFTWTENNLCKQGG
jgi:RHS repeat-associated protein